MGPLTRLALAGLKARVVGLDKEEEGGLLWGKMATMKGEAMGEGAWMGGQGVHHAVNLGLVKLK